MGEQKPDFLSTETSNFRREGRRSFKNYERLQAILASKFADEDYAPADIGQLLYELEEKKPDVLKYRLPPEVIDDITVAVDQIVGSGQYVQKMVRFYRELAREEQETLKTGDPHGFHQRALRKINQIYRRLDRVVKQRTIREEHDFMRSLDNCFFQATTLAKTLKANPALTNVSILPIFGFTAHSVMHAALAAFPSETLPSFNAKIEHSRQKINAALSIDTIFTPSAPAIASLTIIDPTFLQACDEKIHHAQQLNPTCITDTGVFVGSFADYVGLLTYLDDENLGEVEFEISTKSLDL